MLAEPRLRPEDNQSRTRNFTNKEKEGGERITRCLGAGDLVGKWEMDPST